MLDVYRNFYHFTGEPFRLGPDYRFSLHHSSYANARAYLEYAIFQGEGFVTITGGPGTGKTTLISEILSIVDKDKIEVSTLTSTQLESRDLLYMVAHSLGIQSGDDSKASLLVEIESYLVGKIRSGHRAILIVDEAQGLSGGAIEELRLLANLQHEYQLLLQIILVGQEQLLELIQQPAMEHLRQRLVAATSLEPLGLDESIDYIEHRLSRVAWKGDPGIDEGALRLMYRYSGGIPRRINLIMNRLFLYGGMDEKHHFTAEDAKEVIKGLIEEFLLPSDPLIDEADVETRNAVTDARRPRHLPREPAEKPTPEKPEQTKTSARRPGKSRIHSPRTTGGDMDIGSARRNQAQDKNQPQDKGQERKSSKSTMSGQRPGDVTQTAVRKKRPANIPVDDEPEKRKGGKGLFVAVMLLAGAGSTYLLREEPVSLDRIVSLVTEIKGQYQSSVTMLDPKPESEKQTPVVEPIVRSSVPDDVSDAHPNPVLAESETMVAEQAEPVAQESETPVEVVRADVPVTQPLDKPEKAEEPSVSIPEPVKPAEPVAQESETPVEVVRADVPVTQPLDKPEKAEEPSVSIPESVKPAEPVVQESETPVEVARADVPVSQSLDAPGKAEELSTLIPAPVETGKLHSDDAIEARRAELKRDAQQRFDERKVSALARTTVPSQQITPIPVTRTVPQVAINRPVAVNNAVQPKKKSRITAEKVKQTLLQGRWSSAGKPASLLPSGSTSCREQSAGLACSSVPQNVKTQYGLALYKVETKLSKFSAEGHFELAYRTLVRLVGDSAGKQPADDDAGWQVTEYSMSCTLSTSNTVSCLDGKGITREYRRALSNR